MTESLFQVTDERVQPPIERQGCKTSLFSELQLLNAASRLRVSHPARARLCLDEYKAQYPRGILSEEYEVLRLRLESNF